MRRKDLGRLTKQDMMKRIKNAGIGSEIAATEVLEAVSLALAKEFEGEIASAVKPLFFRNNTVTLRANSSIIAQEIRLKEEALAKRINEQLGKEMVKHFLWRIE